VAEEGVVVERNVAILAVQHLVEQGRGHGKSAGVLADKVQRLVHKQWGTSKVPRFEDEESGGWLIDVSPAFDGEAMYAVVRTQNGTRAVTKIIEEDDAVKMMGNPGAPEKPAVDEVEVDVDVEEDDDEDIEYLDSDPETLIPEGSPLLQNPPFKQIVKLEQERDELQSQVATLRRLVNKLTPKDDDSVLLCWKGDPSAGGEHVKRDGKPRDNQIEVSHSQVSSAIQALITAGIDPEHVEVWSRRQKPKVKVELV